MKEKLELYLGEIMLKCGYMVGKPEVVYPKEMGHGDYMSSTTLAISKQYGKSPRDMADAIVEEMRKDLPPYIESVDVAGPGFINFHLSREYFTGILEFILRDGEHYGKSDIFDAKKVVVEYTQPNPFKPFHIGHLMSNAIGESIARLVDFHGGEVIRANYQGDIGPHIAKAMYGIIKKGEGILGKTVNDKAAYIGECYAYGAALYEDDPAAKAEMDEINKKLYAGDSVYKEIYDEGRKVTLEAFEEIYVMLGTKFDKYYFESELAPKGVALVKDYMTKGIFEESEGAIIFRAERFNPKLHTRVFLTSSGLPLYDAKELALTVAKFTDFEPDLCIVDTAVEQKDYMAVVTEAIRQMFPREGYAARMEHVNHGMMRFASGKMSSRRGNVITGESLIRDAKDAIMEIIRERDFTDAEKKEVAEAVGVAAIKYSILRSSVGSDIIFDFEKSISFEGDSGPYLQYAATRARAVCRKAEGTSTKASLQHPTDATLTIERILERFPAVALRAVEEREPHHIATYMMELAGSFNSFYAQEQIIVDGDPTSNYKVAVAGAVATVLTKGLHLLGIKIPEKM
ncbi:MAG: arginine--tRNA ligase [Candidatus Pacebacteria bacterium]|nr:arginine--tRNA ligase [Candidatus Paceibacterota bacterium]